jgi:hypothetical protein
MRILPTVPIKMRALAGLETGVIGAALLLGWFTLDAIYQGQHWYAFPNLWSTIFYGQDAFRMRAGWASAAGIALHFCLLGIAGLAFGVVWRWSSRFYLTLLAGITWSMLWYWWLNFGFWKSFAPLVPRLMPQPATGLAFFLFGVCLSRVPHRGERFAKSLESLPAPLLLKEGVQEVAEITVFPPPLPSQVSEIEHLPQQTIPEKP